MGRERGHQVTFDDLWELWKLNLAQLQFACAGGVEGQVVCAYTIPREEDSEEDSNELPLTAEDCALLWEMGIKP